MIGSRLIARLLGRGAERGPAPASAEPTPDPAPPPSPVPDLFGLALTELRCALACYDLVDEVARADGERPGERERLAHIYAGWALARAAERARRTYGEGGERAP